jgi:uncharacterized cupredoxin-like copper-binding protein
VVATTDAEPAARTPSDEPPRPPVRRGWRDLRPTLLTVAALLIASFVAIGIAYALMGSSEPSGDIQASTVEYRISMPTRLLAGKHTIGYTNDGTIPHEIVMFRTDLPANDLPTEANGDVNEESPLLTNVADSGDALAAGGTKSFTTHALAPGHYVAVCNLPGHYKLGMKLDVTVPG